MLQDISMLDLRRKIGQIVDLTLYQKDRFIVRRKGKPVAALIPIEDFECFMNDDDIEIYSDKRVQEFMDADKINKQTLDKATRILES